MEGLLAHQEQVLAILQGGEVMLGDNVRDTAGLARTRWTLMRALTAYQLFKHREVFDPLLAKAKPADAHRLLKMKQACTALGEAFREHVQTWSAADTPGRWDEYQPAARAMAARIRAHLTEERARVTVLLKGS